MLTALIALGTPRLQVGTVPAGWHAVTGTEKKLEKWADCGIFRRRFSSYNPWLSRSYTLQFCSILHFPLQHPSLAPFIHLHLSHPLSAGILLTSTLRCPLIFSISSFSLPVMLFVSPHCACAKVALWQQYGGLFLFLFHSYSPRPFAHAHARPRSSPDWMALCQPATAIALICSSSLRCPSPCLYISIPLSSPHFIHPLCESFTLCVRIKCCVCICTQYYLNDAYTTFHFLNAHRKSLLFVVIWETLFGT